MKRFLVALGLTLLTIPLQAQDVFSVKLNEVLANGSLLLGVSNRPIDRVELYNNSAAPVDLAGCSLTDSSGADPWLSFPKFIFPANSVVPPLGYLVVNLDPDLHFGLQTSGDTLYFRNPERFDIDFIAFGLQVADKSIGRVPDGVGDWTLTVTNFGSPNVAIPLGDPSSIKINEWRASSPDFVELFNTGDRPIHLGGLRLADEQVKAQPWLWHVVPNLSFIGTGRSGGFTVFEEGGRGATLWPFGLSRSGGDSITVAWPDYTVIDAVAITPQDNDVSTGRVPDGGTNIMDFPRRVTKGKPNFGVLTRIQVSEILAHTDPPLEDAIEFYNPTDEPVDMSGWWMSDKQSKPNRFVFPQGTIVPAKGYYVLYEYQFRAAGDDYTFNSAHGDTNYVYEVDATGNAVAYSEVRFGASLNGVSFGRVETTDGDIDYVAMGRRTFGQDGTLPAGTAGLTKFRQGLGLTNDTLPKWGPVIINEVMYRPPDIGTNNNTIHEYIELRNVTSKPVKLYETLFRAPWKLGGKGDVFYQFASTDIIPANGHLLLVSFNPADAGLLNNFKAAYGLPDTTVIRGPYNGGTNFLNRDTTIELYRPDKPEDDVNDFGFVPQVLVDRVHYEPDQPWPTNSSGTGTSLQRVGGGSYGDEPASWFDDFPTPGWPNAQKVVITSAPVSHGVLVSNAAILSVSVELASSNTPASMPTYQWMFKNKPIATADARTDTLTIPSFTKVNSGTYSCVVSNFAGRVATAAATLKPVLPVTIKKMLPVSPLTVAAGKTVVFKPLVKGTKPFTYMWYKDDVELTGQTGSSYKIVGVTAENSGTYKVIVSNGLSSADASVELTVQ